MSAISFVIKNIHPDATITDRESGDVLGENALLKSGSVLTADSLIPQYNTPAYEVHAIRPLHESLRLFSVRLDLPSGCSRKRTDRIVVNEQGNITIAETFDKGLFADTMALGIQKRSEGRRGAKFHFDGAVYVGVLGSIGQDEDLGIGGLDLLTNRELICNREQFGNETPIETQDVIGIGQYEYRVDDVSVRTASVSFMLKRVGD